jgi:hypothetical protein
MHAQLLLSGFNISDGLYRVEKCMFKRTENKIAKPNL